MLSSLFAWFGSLSMARFLHLYRDNNISLSLISVLGGLLYLYTVTVTENPISYLVISLGSVSAFITYSRTFAGPINELANISGVTPSTAYSMMDKNRRDISITTIKKFCDGLDITLGEFFSCEVFDNLDWEIK